MKIIFFGLGSIGRRHAEILQKKYNHQLFAFRSDKRNSGNELKIPEIYKWSEVKKLNPDVAFITNPTALHIKTAQKCADLKLKLFIDKPIGDKLNGLENLVNSVKSQNLTSYVGYNMRFHPVIEILKKYFTKNNFLHMKILTTSYLPNWRKGTDFKKSYRTNKNLGGGVILDLSHEFDYIDYLTGGIKSMNGNFSKRSSLTNNVEDYADILISTNSGPTNLHINFFSHKNRREIQIDFEKLTVVADLLNSTIEEYKKEELISKKQFEKARNISFEKQLEYFFYNIDNPKIMNNLIDASRLFKQIVKFKK